MDTGISAYQRRFIELAIDYDALSFGEFELKSGRISPYFFNAGKFNSGRALAVLGRCYADAIVAQDMPCDLLFGPAYKGIPLVAVTAAALSEYHDRDVPFCYNRKEAKDHGEGGMLVGAPLQGDVLVIDDVITAGTAIGEVIGLVEKVDGAQVSSVLVGLDRQERGKTSRQSAIQELRATHHICVNSIIGLTDVKRFLLDEGKEDLVQSIDRYQQKYRADEHPT